MSTVRTHKRTARNPTRVSNVAAHTTKTAISEGTRQQNVPCVAGITQRTTRAASIITILSKNKIHTIPPKESSIPIPTFAYNHITTPHGLPQHADVASNRAQLAEEPITTFKAFLENFKGLFAQLIHRNTFIINMITILNKPH